MSESQHSILGISFDGLAISGIVNEFLNVAEVLRRNGLRVLFDLGYDITMGRTTPLGAASFPDWLEPIRCIGKALPKSYNASVVEEARSRVISGTSIAAAGVYGDLCRELAALLVCTFTRENVRFLIIENGTLPDNPLFTEAIYLAIAEYGATQGLGKYVLWRDHDLMWSAEPQLYGSYPYPGVRKPHANKHINYVVATEWMRKRMQAWAPSIGYKIIPNRFFSSIVSRAEQASLRRAFGIPKEALLVGRCTRVIPQKTIERDLRLLRELQYLLSASGDPRKIFLFVTGPTGEDVIEFDRLRSLEHELSLVGQVVWGNGLEGVNPLSVGPSKQPHWFSVRDLLNEADLSSFLTSYDYEGFGNPPGEAMAMGVPFISTTYELYHEVYGSKGAVAPLLPIDRTSSPKAPIPDFFIEWTLRVLMDHEYRAEITRRNQEVCKRFFSLDALERQLRENFLISLN